MKNITLLFFLSTLSLLSHAQSAPIEGACLRFEDALAISAQRDPAVSSALAQRLEADAEVINARSLYKPQISTFGRTGRGDVGLVDSVIQNQVGLRTSQRLLDFGDARFARRAALHARDASDQDISQARLVAARDTGVAYLAMQEAAEQMQAVEQRLGFFARQLNALEALLPSGGATRSETAEVAARLADAQAEDLELEFQYEQAYTRIELDTGLVPIVCPNDRYESQLTNWVQQFADREAAITVAIQESPIVSALEKRADGFDATYKRTKRNRFPIINIVSLNSFAGSDGGSLDLQDRIGLDVTIPLYNGSAGKARAQRAKAQAKRARSEVDESRRRLHEDVSITYRRIESLQAQLRSREIVEEQNRAQFEAAQTEYDAGARTLPELVDARVDYEDSVLTRIRLKYDLLRQRMQLLTLTGRLPLTPTTFKPFG